MDKFEKCKNILKEHNQEHLLDFYDLLSDRKKTMLLNQILRIDLKEICELYKNSYIEPEKNDVITPLPYIDRTKLTEEEIDYYYEIGLNSIKNNEFAVITLAGGQGTRLGHTGPKGTFELKLVHAKKSLFEILCDNLNIINNSCHISIPWYIMTSTNNNKATIEFFEENNYFNYPNKNIHFFTQNKLPITDVKGKLMLSELHVINEASNGNGDVYNSLNEHNIISDLKQKGVKWIFICGIDNVLVKPVDPLFLGLTIKNNYEIASKSIFKEDGEPKNAVFANRNGHPSILMLNEITEEMNASRDPEGNYLYRDTNALCHLYSINALEKCATLNLPYHRAYKKNTFINEEGMKQIPESPNSFKFEKFIFDAFDHFDKMLLLRVEKNKEFAPIKDLDGMHEATKLYEKRSDENEDGSNFEKTT